MRLDASVLRFLNNEHFRVLQSVEQGMKSHELVPTPLIERIAGLRCGGTKKLLGMLCKYKLIVHENNLYDGYRLVYLGYDYLALHAFLKRNAISGLGPQIGKGKESDCYMVNNDEGVNMILKLHRLGRTSFQTVTLNRDYYVKAGKRRGRSWLYLSKLSAGKEFEFMEAVYEEGFPVPTPLDHNRHAVLMSLAPGYTLANISKIEHVEAVYEQCLDLVVRLACHERIHCDMNEFNLMVSEDEKVTLIDFPQMVKTSHRNADMYFNRDLQCIHDYFARKYNILYNFHPTLEEAMKMHGGFNSKATETVQLTPEALAEIEARMEARKRGELVGSDDDDDAVVEDDDDGEEQEEDIDPDDNPIVETEDLEDDDNDDDSDDSLGTATSDMTAALRIQKQKEKTSPDYIKARVKQKLEKQDDRAFSKRINGRNLTKGWQKSKTGRKVAKGMWDEGY